MTGGFSVNLAQVRRISRLPRELYASAAGPGYLKPELRLTGLRVVGFAREPPSPSLGGRIVGPDLGPAARRPDPPADSGGETHREAAAEPRLALQGDRRVPRRRAVNRDRAPAASHGPVTPPGPGATVTAGPGGHGDSDRGRDSTCQ